MESKKKTERKYLIKTKKGFLRKGVIGSYPEFTNNWVEAKMMDSYAVEDTAKYHSIRAYEMPTIVVTYELHD